MVKSEEEEISSIAKNVRDLYKKKPSIIFLTETSAIPDGYAFKEAWKRAYPNEKCPVFYRIDPNALYNMKDFYSKIRKLLETNEHNNKFDIYKKTLEENRLGLRTFLKKRIKDKNAAIFVYDEDSVTGFSPKIVYDLLTNPEEFGLEEEFKCKNVSRVIGYYENEETGIEHLTRVALRPKITLKSKFDTSYPFKDIKLTGNVNRLDRKTSLEAIKHFKHLGRKAGEEIRQEEQKKKSLEHRVTSIIAICSFLASFLFLSSKITGNAIVDLTTKTTSFIGAGLFVIGSIAVFFWLKNRKK